MFKVFLSKRKEKKPKAYSAPVLFLFLFLSIFVLRSSVNYSRAGEADNVRGWAWSSTVGWISLNCLNNDTCGTFDYGVRINPGTLNFSGYAWSSAVGWISFQDSGAPSYVFNANCESFCGAGNNCTACLDTDTGNIWGWAHIVSMGSDGWIKLRDEGASWPGTRIDQSSASSTWRGWAWNGNDDGSGIGWVNFNCLEESWCATSNYTTWVKNMTFPSVDDMRAPNWGFADACSIGSKGAILSWRMEDPDEGAFQSAYRVIVNTTNSTSTPLIDTGKVMSTAQQYATTSPLLAYNTRYYWWVKVWDNFGLGSGWFQFNHSTASSTLTDNIVANSGFPDSNLTFRTYQTEFPSVSFSYNPLKPVVDEEVYFTDQSSIYMPAAPSTPVACTKATCSWLWSGDGIKTISDDTASSTMMTFEYGDHIIGDRVTDPKGYVCTGTSFIFIDLLPKWREIKPLR